MSLVACRYNPNHKMKASKREIHELKCPDRLKCQIKYKHCPYDPLELIREEEYEKHLLECKNMPRITEEEQKSIEKAIEKNNIDEEKEQIKYARERYYKGCVEESDIPGISEKSKKINKKKQNRISKKKCASTAKKEEEKFPTLEDNEHDNDDDDDDENHNLSDLSADEEFNLNNKHEETDEQKKNDIKIDSNNNKKDKDKKKENNKKKVGMFYRYDPNEEDKDIDKFSANILVPHAIYEILQ